MGINIFFVFIIILKTVENKIEEQNNVKENWSYELYKITDMEKCGQIQWVIK